MNASARVLFGGTLTVFASIALAQTVPGEAKDKKPLPASIHGWAVHPDGTPLWTVEIEPVKFGGASAVVLVSQRDGAFESEALPPGRYRLGVSLGLNRQPCQAYPRTYYSGTPSVAQSQEIEIGESEALRPILFTGPAKRPHVTIQGIVFYADGKPAVGADVYLTQIDENHSTYDMWTDSKGAFRFETYGAVDHEIISKSRDEKLEAAKQVIPSADLEKPLRLVLVQK